MTTALASVRFGAGAGRFRWDGKEAWVQLVDDLSGLEKLEFVGAGLSFSDMPRVVGRRESSESWLQLRQTCRGLPLNFARSRHLSRRPYEPKHLRLYLHLGPLHLRAPARLTHRGGHPRGPQDPWFHHQQSHSLGDLVLPESMVRHWLHLQDSRASPLRDVSPRVLQPRRPRHFIGRRLVVEVLHAFPFPNLDSLHPLPYLHLQNSSSSHPHSIRILPNPPDFLGEIPHRNDEAETTLLSIIRKAGSLESLEVPSYWKSDPVEHACEAKGIKLVWTYDCKSIYPSCWPQAAICISHFFPVGTRRADVAPRHERNTSPSFCLPPRPLVLPPTRYTSPFFPFPSASFFVPTCVNAPHRGAPRRRR